MAKITAVFIDESEKLDRARVAAEARQHAKPVEGAPPASTAKRDRAGYMKAYRASKAPK